MKTPLIGIAVVWISLTAFLLWHYREPHGLPHRPVTELTNWGQGHAPESNRCPRGTIRFETDDGLFLECYRSTNQ